MSEFTIREAVPDDAEAIIAYMTRIADEPNNGVLVGPGEFDYTLEQERKIIQDLSAADNSTMLLVVAGSQSEAGEPVGLLICTGGRRRANHHAVTLGITIKKEWRNQGVGTALMSHAIQWARETGVVKRIELEVYTTNPRAIHVYEKLGFKVEGTKGRAFFKNGQFIDSLVMALLL